MNINLNDHSGRWSETLEHRGWRILICYLLVCKWHHPKATQNAKVSLPCLHGVTWKYIENIACYFLTGDIMAPQPLTIIWPCWHESWLSFAIGTCPLQLTPGLLWCVGSVQLYHLPMWRLCHRSGNSAFPLPAILTEMPLSSFTVCVLNLFSFPSSVL